MNGELLHIGNPPRYTLELSGATITLTGADTKQRSNQLLIWSWQGARIDGNTATWRTVDEAREVWANLTKTATDYAQHVHGDVAHVRHESSGRRANW